MYGQSGQPSRRRGASDTLSNGSLPSRAVNGGSTFAPQNGAFPVSSPADSSTGRQQANQTALDFEDDFSRYAPVQPHVEQSTAFYAPSNYSNAQQNYQFQHQQRLPPSQSQLPLSNSDAYAPFPSSRVNEVHRNQFSSQTEQLHRSTNSSMASSNPPLYGGGDFQNSFSGNNFFPHSSPDQSDVPSTQHYSAEPYFSQPQQQHHPQHPQHPQHSQRHQHHQHHQQHIPSSSLMAGQEQAAFVSAADPQFLFQPHQSQPRQNVQQGSAIPANPSLMSSVGPGLPGVPMFLAGMAQQFVGAGNMDAGQAAAALAPQLMQNLGVQGYFENNTPGDSFSHFMRFPKHYFAVNHSYVLRKLALLLMPFTKRSWSRKRTVDQGQFEGSGADHATAYLPPRDDLNAPDLYIPVMSFVSYVLMVGFLFGTRDAFSAEVLAKYCSKGLGVLTLEVLIIKLGLYLINARPTPWLDVIAYRGYKFVGVMLAMAACSAFPKLYYLVVLYSSTAMAIFLMRSHRRIILPREADHQEAGDLTQRNIFLLFLCALQYPIYWLLILDARSIQLM